MVKNIKRLLPVLLLLCLVCVIFVACNKDNKAPAETSDSSSVTVSAPVSMVVETTEREKTEETTAAAEETTAPVEVKLSAVSVMTLKGLPSSGAVQQFAFAELDGHKTVFAVQREKTTLYISRCLVSDNGKEAAIADYAALPGFGHGESLDISLWKGKVYIYVTDGANPLNSYAWGTKVTRFQYSPGGIVTDKKTITDVVYATSTGKILNEGATPYRINFALDDTADVICFYIRADQQSTAKNIGHYLIGYRLGDINAMLDECDGELSLSKCGKHLIGRTVRMAVAGVCHNESFQGMEVTPEGDILISGGTNSAQPSLSRFVLKSNMQYERREIKTVDYIKSKLLGDLDLTGVKSYPEIESIRYYNGDYYVSFNPEGWRIKDNTEIYSINLK